MRQIPHGRILTVEGGVKATCRIETGKDKNGTPVFSLEPPAWKKIALGDVKTTYAGEEIVPRLFDRIDWNREMGGLRTVIARQLIKPMASLPSYVYLPVSFLRRGLLAHEMVGNYANPDYKSQARIIEHKRENILIFGMAQSNKGNARIERIKAVPFASQESAIALTMSEEGINCILDQLGQRNYLAGRYQDARGGPGINWQWEKLHVQCYQGMVGLEGIIRINGYSRAIHAYVQCALDHHQNMTCRAQRPFADQLTEVVVLQSWQHMLKRLFRARNPRKADDNLQERERLIQCFTLSGTNISIEANAHVLDIEDGSICLQYQIEKGRPFVPLIPVVKPEVCLRQTSIPEQFIDGTEVVAGVQAQIPVLSYPPYDYVWSSGCDTGKVESHINTHTLRKVPPPGLPAGQHQLTEVRVKVIDMFGQVEEASLPVLYSRKEQAKGEGVPKPKLGGNAFANATTTPNSANIPNIVATPKHTFRVRLPGKYSTGIGCIGCLLVICILIVSCFPRNVPQANAKADFTVSPNILSATADCIKEVAGWRCSVIVSFQRITQAENQGGNEWGWTQKVYAETQEQITWKSSSKQEGVLFEPTQGTLNDADKSKSTVEVFIPGALCPGSKSVVLQFTGSNNVSRDVEWKCPAEEKSQPPPVVEPQLSVTPASIDIAQDCERKDVVRYCSVRLHNSGGVGKWSAEENSIVGVSPTNGIIGAGKDQDLSLIISEKSCSETTIGFSSGKSKTSVSLKNCPSEPPPVVTTVPPVVTTVPPEPKPEPRKPWLTVIPGAIVVQGGGHCSEVQSYQVQVQDSVVWACPITLRNTGNGEEYWETEANASSQVGSIPAGGSGETIVYLPKYCDNSTITFTGLNNKATITISGCPEVPKTPNLVVEPSIINVQTCPTGGDARTRSCEIKLSNTGNADDFWQNPSGDTDPEVGTLAQGDSEYITIYVEYYCANNAMTTIQGRANSVSVQITGCPAKPIEEPLLVVEPGEVQHLSCPREGGSVNCKVKLWNYGNGVANWSASGDPGVRISSPGLPLSPIQPGVSVEVTLNVPYICDVYQITFFAGNSQVTLRFVCTQPI